VTSKARQLSGSCAFQAQECFVSSILSDPPPAVHLKPILIDVSPLTFQKGLSQNFYFS
jgi:hypothetical protein